MPETYDGVIIGSGPNGLAAAITLAQSGWRVLVVEGRDQIGGGMRTEELTLPGYHHDVCSAIHPLGFGSPFFRSLPLDAYGLEWIHPPLPLAHPLDGGRAALLEHSARDTAGGLGVDAHAYRSLMSPLVENWRGLVEDILGPFPLPPRHPLLDLRFAWFAARSARGLAERLFRGEIGQALFAGMAAHSMLPLDKIPSAAFGLLLGVLGHAVGWPFPRGGSGQIAAALGAYLRTLGGEIRTGWWVQSLDDLPPARVVLADITPRQLLRLAGKRLPDGYRRQLARYRYGAGVFKIDWALSDPIPWQAGPVGRAGTVHIGGRLEEVVAAEQAVWRGEHPERPFVLLSQPSRFDPRRAPQGKHTAWAYCHVPTGSQVDMTVRIEAQIERFAPGFRDCILARNVMNSADMEAYNPNYIGGDINGGVQDLWQHFTRPVWRLRPYRTALRGLYLCSSSTPPGGGVHGMSGYYAARTALQDAGARE